MNNIVGSLYARMLKERIESKIKNIEEKNSSTSNYLILKFSLRFGSQDKTF